MSNFKQNTVETVGDAALADSIVDRSITELQDNITMSIAAQKFRGCDALASVIFPSVSSVGIGAFWQCTALAQVDFAACVSIAQNAFYGCSALETLILRNEEAVSSLTGNLAGTKIASGTGYIYVPSALVDTYKATSGWSTYAAQIRAIEDYPLLCSKWSWGAVFACIEDGTYASVYSVGDTVPLDLGTEGVVNMQIAAFDTDDKADGSGKAPISWISKDVLATTHRMNPALVTNDDSTYQEGTGMIGGWEKSELRTYLNDTIKPLIPENVRNQIVSVTKTQPAYDTSGASITQTTQDDVWIPSYAECFSSGIYTGLFTSSDSRIKYKVGTTSAKEWGMRDAQSTGVYKITSTSGDMSSYGVTANKSVALGFCT